MHIIDEAPAFHSHLPSHRQQQQFIEEYGTEGMEYTPSASSNNYINYQLSDPSYKTQHKENDTDAIIESHYGQLISQSKGSQRTLPSAQKNPFIQQSTPGFQSLNDSNIQNNLPQNLNQQGMIEKLSAKLRSQAERLQFLENYKLLCERRIKDFEPTHPFPVIPSHVGVKPTSPPPTAVSNNSNNFIQALQQRNNELQQEAGQSQEFRRRLQQVEESLRSETLANEEQRAYIQVLRETLENKIQQSGLSFKGSNKVESNVEGYIQLLQATKLNDQLKNENQKLLKQIKDFEVRMSDFEQSLKQQFQSDLQDLSSQFLQKEQVLVQKIESVKSKKSTLKHDKNNLLDYVEETLQKQQKEDEIKQGLLKQLDEKSMQISGLQRQYEELVSSKAQQDELVGQVQANLKQMRVDKEDLNQQITLLKAHVEQLDSQHQHDAKIISDKEDIITRYHTDLREKDKQLSDKHSEIISNKSSHQKEFDTLDQTLKSTKSQLKDKEKSVESIRTQLDEQTLKAKTLTETNYALTKTLRETQDELDKLVTRHDQVSKTQKQQEREFLSIKKRLQECEAELAERTQNYNEIRTRDTKREKEIQELYSSLGQKDKVVKDCESRLIKNLKEKELECTGLQKKVEQLIAEMKESTSKVEFLEKLNDDKLSEVQKLKQTVDLKKNVIDDIQNQLKRHKEEVEQERFQKDRTVSVKLNEQERKELELTYRLTQTQDELKGLREQKGQAEKMLLDKIESLRTQEIDILRKEEKLTRWEKEIERLEAKLQKGDQKSETLQIDFDRIRSQRVDDAMLIDQLRSSQKDQIDSINEIIGAITNFNQVLDNIGMIDSCSKEIESLYTIGSKFKVVSENDNLREIIKSVKLYLTTQSTLIKKLILDSQNTSVMEKPRQLNSPPQKEDWPFNQKIQTQSLEELRQIQMDNEYQKVIQLPDKSIELKQKLELQEELLSLEKQEKGNMEQILRRVISMQCFSTKIKKILSDLLQNSKDLSDIKTDRSVLVQKLQVKEQKYHALNRGNSTSIVQRDITLLKGSIERERQELNGLDSRVSEHQRRQTVLFDELMSVDVASATNQQDRDIQNHGLLQQIDELQKLNIELRQEKQWADKRLSEIEDQLTRFNIQPSSGAPLRSPTRADMPLQQQESRLHWPSKRLTRETSLGANSRQSQQHISLQANYKTTNNYQSDNVLDHSQDAMSKPQPIQHSRLRSRVQTSENLEAYMNKGQQLPPRKEEYYSGSYNVMQRDDSVSQDMSRLDQSSVEQTGATLKDKIQQVKTIFNSIRRNCMDDQ